MVSGKGVDAAVMDGATLDSPIILTGQTRSWSLVIAPEAEPSPQYYGTENVGEESWI